MNLTSSQRAAVEHRGSSLLVSASAGSGKTEVLARRCVSIVADAARPCDVDRLLVVTFTRAAAAELRVRIARQLRQQAAQGGDPALTRHLHRQALLVDAADIGTIDAWCGRIVREHFAEAGVDVNFTVLDEQESVLLRRSVLDELFEGLYRGTDPLDVEARAWLAHATVPDDRFLRELIHGLNRFREHLVNPEAWLAAQHAAAQHYDAESVLAAALADECRFQADQLAAMCAGNALRDAAAALAPYRTALQQWAAALNSPDRLLAVVGEIDAFRIPKARRGDSEPPQLTEVRSRWLEARLQKLWSPTVVEPLLKYARPANQLMCTLLALEARYEKLLHAAKHARAAYEFSDVLRLALDLLGTAGTGPQRTPTAIARRLQRRYEHVLVDEYQDTSPVQVEILRLVTRDSPGRSNRFMVGDVKQSIYGFRQAAPQLFTALTAAIAAGREDARVQFLSDNFRSHPAVLDGLNAMFAQLFDPALGGTAFGPDERLRAGRTDVPNPTLDAQPRIGLHVIELPRYRSASEPADDEEPEVERIELEAQIAAEQIQQMFAAHTQIPERTPDGTVRLRPLRRTDIVVLLRSAVQNASLVARVLRANGLRAVASGREALLDALEVGDVVNVLRLLVNRRQDVPLAAYLRGPFIGLSAADLLAIRTSAPGAADFLDAVTHGATRDADASLQKKLAAALAQLDAWNVVARQDELPALLQRILSDSQLVLFAAGLPGGEQRVALLRALQSLAAEHNRPGEGIAEFVAHLDELAATELMPGALALADDEVVRVMTIHAAKGLEFPVVFLLGTGARFNAQSQAAALQCDEAVGLGLRFKDYPARAEIVSPRHAIIRQRLRRRELEEELRLLYVATTRARECLFVVGCAVPGSWPALVAAARGASTPPLLITRLSVQSRLEWLLLATAAAHLHEAPAGHAPRLQVTLHAPDQIQIPDSALQRSAPPPGPAAPADQDWIARGRQLLTTPLDRSLVDVPAVLSVSAAKEWGRRASAEDSPARLAPPPLHLGLPAFAAAAAPDSRDLGTACHRFLEFADLTRLGTPSAVETQVSALVASGRMSAEQAALLPIADLAWLGTTPEGTLLAQHAQTLRREVPFVHALPIGTSGEHTIIRGIIDCLIDTPAGLIVLDYKTDAIRDDHQLADRVAAYTIQLQLYALAAAQIFARPVTRAALIFLRARRVIDVPTDTRGLQFPDLLAG